MSNQEKSRMGELLLAAADALDDGRDPFEHSFLVEHEVTYDECGNMAEQVAFAIRIYREVMRMGLHPTTPADRKLAAAIIAGSLSDKQLTGR